MIDRMIDEPAKKVARRLEREISYYAGIALRAATRDGVRLAHMAIAAREQRLKNLVGIDVKQKEKR
jgi:hypothetical protein